MYIDKQNRKRGGQMFYQSKGIKTKQLQMKDGRKKAAVLNGMVFNIQKKVGILPAIVQLYQHFDFGGSFKGNHILSSSGDSNWRAIEKHRERRRGSGGDSIRINTVIISDAEKVRDSFENGKINKPEVTSRDYFDIVETTWKDKANSSDWLNTTNEQKWETSKEHIFSLNRKRLDSLSDFADLINVKKLNRRVSASFDNNNILMHVNGSIWEAGTSQSAPKPKESSVPKPTSVPKPNVNNKEYAKFKPW